MIHVDDIIMYRLSISKLNLYGLVIRENKDDSFYIKKTSGKISRLERNKVKLVKTVKLPILKEEYHKIRKGVFVIKHKITKKWEDFYTKYKNGIYNSDTIIWLYDGSNHKVVIRIRDIEKVVYRGRDCNHNPINKLFIEYDIKEILFDEWKEILKMGKSSSVTF